MTVHTQTKIQIDTKTMRDKQAGKKTKLDKRGWTRNRKEITFNVGNDIVIHKKKCV